MTWDWTHVARTIGEHSKVPPKRSVLGMTLSYIWWWGSTAGDLKSVEYAFIVIMSWTK